MTTTTHTTIPAEVSVLDAMRPGVVTCRPAARIPQLASMMVRHGIRVVLVASGEQRNRVMVTDRELMRAALDSSDASAAELAREPVVTLPADTPLTAAVAVMAERYITHLLITDPSSGAPRGVLSSFDVAVVASGTNPRYARMPRPGPARPSMSARTLGQAEARDAMHSGIITVPAHAPLTSVARSMADYRIHCVAVAGIDPSGGHLTWGLIDDMDLLLAVHRGELERPAASIAATQPVAVTEEESLAAIASAMLAHDVSHVAVVGGSGLPAGMVSTHDVMAGLAAQSWSAVSET